MVGRHPQVGIGGTNFSVFLFYIVFDFRITELFFHIPKVMLNGKGGKTGNLKPTKRKNKPDRIYSQSITLPHTYTDPGFDSSAH